MVLVSKHLKFWPENNNCSYELMHIDIRSINEDPGKSVYNTITPYKNGKKANIFCQPGPCIYR